MKTSATDLVLVDTCIWVSYFQRKASRNKQAVGELLDQDRVCIIAPIIFEILRGIKNRDQANWLGSELRKLPEIEIDWDDWIKASDLHRKLAETEINLPMADLCISAVALRHDLAVFSIDPHFDSIQNLKRFTP